MSASVLALCVGLALLGVALVLILHTSSPDSPSDATTDQNEPDSTPGEARDERKSQSVQSRRHAVADAAPDENADARGFSRAGSAHQREERGHEQKREQGKKQEQEPAQDSSDNSSVAPASAATGSVAAESPRGRHAAEEQSAQAQSDDVPADDVSVNESASEKPEREPAAVPAGRHGLKLNSVKKRRRQWAHDNGFEYTREDRDLLHDWPVSLIGGDYNEVPVAKDVVSGFAEGHRTHIADVGTTTMLAMRRDGYSHVDVQYSASEGGSQPEGMRRVEALDQAPFLAYTSDIRALDHMLDVRVEDGLAALSEVASDIAWSGQWVALRINRKLDTSVWEEIFPHVRMLADAAMVLPPEQISIPLEMDLADPTRPIPGGEHRIDLDEIAGLGSADTDSDSQTSSSRGRHLRAMPDASASEEKPAYDDPRLDSSESAAEETVEESAFRSGELFGGEGFDEYDERPEITRPAEPVEFPSRSTGHVGGNTDTFQAFHVADAGDDDESETYGSHARGRHRHIPRLGEDPAHRSSSSDQRGQIIRNDDSEATIFYDYEDDGMVLRAEAEPVGFGSFSDTAEGGEDLSNVARLRRQRRHEERYASGGRHRAPDARHARPEPIEPVEVEIETVDAEIVDED